MAQLVKNPPAMQETWVRSQGWKHPLEKGKATLSSILTMRIQVAELDTTEPPFTPHTGPSVQLL